MAGQDYVPLFLPGCEPTYVVGTGGVTAGQLVVVGVAADWTVTPTTAATASQVGVASNTKAAGSKVSVYLSGVHLLIASGSITAGVPVKAAAAGAVAAWVAGTDDASLRVGKAQAAASGGFVAVKLL